MKIRLYSRFGRVLSAIVVALMLFAVALIAANEGILAGITAVPFATLVGWLALLLFWLPELVIESEAVTVRNVWSEFVVPWKAIQRIDTKYALTLVTKAQTISVWSAPAPGRHSVFNANREQGRHLPESTYLAGTIRPGDLPQSESGSAAAIIRREWERRRDSENAVGGDEVTRRFRLGLAAITAVLIALVMASLSI